MALKIGSRLDISAGNEQVICENAIILTCTLQTLRLLVILRPGAFLLILFNFNIGMDK